MKHKKGFTLIELLVVIAIIGVIASILITSINEARERAAYAQIQQSLRGFVTQAEMYYLENNSYNGVCLDLEPKLALLRDKGILVSCHTRL